MGVHFKATSYDHDEKTIMELKFDQKKLAHILDNLGKGIIAHNRDRKIFFFNKDAESITGYTRDEAIGKDCHDLFQSPLCGKSCSFCDGDIPDISEKKEYESTISTKSGGVRQIEISVTAMEDDQGVLIGALASFSDITEILELREIAGRLGRFPNIIGRDIKMLQVFRQISDVAHYDYPVHIYGETGTGKELAAHAIHLESHANDAPFVPINCGALPENLVESELFGHVRGSFSGAIRDKKGRFELADGGTIFLDEVAELSKKVQVKLLRFLQEGEFEKVGGETTVSIKARVISATNKNLKKEVAAKRFRDDLYYRLNVIPIDLPPLRRRKNDIPLLAEHFLGQASLRNGSENIRFSPEALSRMMDYHWPGNVRELQNAVMFAIVKSSGGVIKPRHLPMELSESGNPGKRRGALKKLDLGILSNALKEAGGNKSKAARLLGISRATLYRFIKDCPDAQNL